MTGACKLDRSGSGRARNHNFVEDFRGDPAPKTYPVATGLKAVVPGRGKGALLHVSEKKTGWTMAGFKVRAAGDGF